MNKTFFPKGKQLRPGKYCIGPEPSVGCYNTGFAPCIKKSRRYPDFITVGYSGDLLDRETYGKAFRAFLNKRRTFRGNMGKIWLYTTTAPAKRKFEKLCQKAWANYQREANEITALRKQAKQGNLAAVLALGLDY